MLIAIEGIDGCGKGTQTRLLVERASQRGLNFATFSFPRYGQSAFAETIARYLNGEFGDLHQVPAEFAALMYAGDRLAARDELLAACESSDAVICDRYVPSNLAHQAAKLSAERRPDFLRWLEEIEFGIHRLPRPDAVVYLDLPVETSMALVHRKAQRDYTSRAADIHESDTSYLHACQEVYNSLAAADPTHWLTIKCLDAAGELLTADAICATIWQRLETTLPAFGRRASPTR